MSAKTRASSAHHNHFARYLINTSYILMRVGPASSAFGTIGRVHLTPIDVPFTVTIDRIIYIVGGVSAGNVRLGLYGPCTPVVGNPPDLPDTFPPVVESASVAQATNDYFQFVTVNNTQLQPGLYFPGVQGDNVLGTFTRVYDGSQLFARRYDQAYGAFTNPCPATVTLDTVPLFMLRVKSVP